MSAATVVVESRDRTTFAACCWYIEACGASEHSVAVAINARDPQPKRRILLLAGGSGTVGGIRYAVQTLGQPINGGDDRPERYKALRLQGARDDIVAWVHKALDEYRTHVLLCGRGAEGGGGLETFEWDDDGWVKRAPRRRRPLSTLFLPPRVVAVYDDVRRFLASTKAYEARHLAPRRAYMLHGPCGTGKSSLVHCIASELGYALAVVPAACADIRDALARLPPRCVVVVEDVDCGAGTRGCAGFGGVLAALDDCGVDGQPIAVFFTTNRFNELDKALTRRMDYVAELTHASREQARQLYATFFDAGFDEFYDRVCAGKAFPMSALEKYLVKCMHDGHALAHAQLFDVLVRCATEDRQAEFVYT